MMKNAILCKLGRSEFPDLIYYYVLSVAGMVFLHIVYPSVSRLLYRNWLIIPSSLFLGAILERRAGLKFKNYFVFSFAMMAWIVVLQIKRCIDYSELQSMGLFMTTYLFAFPLASLLEDGDKKKALKIFAGAYLAGAAVLSVAGMLLLLDCLPDFWVEDVRWNGGRLEVFRHSNIIACYFLIGIIFCVTLLFQEKSLRLKTGYAVLLILLLVPLVLTSCRTVIVLTGGFLGATVFFELIKHGRKWFLPGVLAVVVVTAFFYEGAIYLYRTNSDALIKKYSRQYAEQIASETDAFAANVESEDIIYEEGGAAADQEETLPIEVNPDTGEIQLIAGSPQDSIEKDLGTLNSRTYIWAAARFAIRETPSILCWGMPNPGEYITYYNFFPVAHTHNAWVECLVGTGVVGFVIAVMITLFTAWNCLLVFLKYYQDIWKRNVAILTLCLMVAAMLEPYLFYTNVDYHQIDLLFFLCAGYLAHWQEADNRSVVNWIRSRIMFLQ